MTHPEALPGLVAEPVAVDGTHVVVKHPTRGRYFRLSKPMAEVLSAMDGTRSIAELGVALGISEARLRGLVDHLDELGLVADARRGAAARPAEGNGAADAGLPRWFRRLMFTSVDVGAADRAVGWLHRRRGFWGVLGSRRVLPAVGLAVLIAVATRWDLLVAGVALSSQPRWWWLVAVVWMVTGPVHEAGHALASKHFGSDVRSLGVGLYFFTPVLYADVSDTWRLTSRRSRVLVHSAGLLAEGALLVVALLALVAVPAATTGAVVGALVVAVGFSLVINANPLLKLDGYFIVSDVLGIDNLREKAFGTLFSRLRAALRRRGVDVEPGAYPPSGGGRARGLTVYAAAMLVYGAAAFGFGAWRLGVLLGSWHAPRPLLYVWVAAGAALFGSFVRYLWRRSAVHASRRF